MKKATFAVLALGFAVCSASSAFAGAVYVPVTSPTWTDGSLHSTEVWVSNPGGTQRGFSTAFRTAGTDGSTGANSPDIPVPARRTFLLSNVGGASGLLEIRSGQEMSVQSRMINTSATGLQTITTVPVISAVNTVGAGKTAYLVGLERDSGRGILSHLGIVNLGSKGAQCEVKLYRVDGSQIGSNVTLSFFALSLRQFDDALGALGEQKIADARVQITCNQPFFAFASVVNQPLSQVWFLSPSAVTTSESGPPTDPAPGPGNSVVFQKSGLLHTATPPSHAKGQLLVPVQTELAVKRMIIEMDWIPGPWNLEKVPGNHAIIWVYRGKFRSNTIANVNAFGPSKFTVKLNQNVDLPAGAVTAEEIGLQLQQGKRYHLKYIYDATTNQITAEVSQGGTLLKTLRGQGTAQGNILSVKPPGLNVEFGHFPGQEGPEIPSWGWSYYDLKIEMVR